MSRRLAQREIALAAIALLAAAVALAVTAQAQKEQSSLPEARGSYSALAGSSGTGALGRRTACGQILRAGTQGVAHPVLPCGVRIYIGYRDKYVLTQVLDRGPSVAGRQFDVTPALAKLLGLTGVQRVTWSYAAAG